MVLARIENRQSGGFHTATRSARVRLQQWQGALKDWFLQAKPNTNALLTWSRTRTVSCSLSGTSDMVCIWFVPSTKTMKMGSALLQATGSSQLSVQASHTYSPCTVYAHTSEWREIKRASKTSARQDSLNVNLTDSPAHEVQTKWDFWWGYWYLNLNQYSISISVSDINTLSQNEFLLVLHRGECQPYADNSLAAFQYP
jgi:hypothetical protein